MKKLILSLVFVFATGTIMNAHSSVEETIVLTSETIEVVEDFGCAGDCVRDSRAAASVMTEDGEDIVDVYMAYYTSCYDARC